MPFDCAPIIDAPKLLPALGRDVLDDPWRTHADVIAAFDGAIAALDTSAI